MWERVGGGTGTRGPSSFTSLVLSMVGKGWLLGSPLRISPILPCARLGKRNSDFWICPWKQPAFAILNSCFNFLIDLSKA